MFHGRVYLALIGSSKQWAELCMYARMCACMYVHKHPCLRSFEMATMAHAKDWRLPAATRAVLAHGAFGYSLDAYLMN